ncbi:MAG: hypothetical protein U0W65_01950 [Bacteroidia bacterium]|nr:hypothetical protein [Bacteroidia bacterium]
MNILFVCRKNQWKSPTAEVIFKNIDGISANSAYTGFEMPMVTEEVKGSRLRSN